MRVEHPLSDISGEKKLDPRTVSANHYFNSHSYDSIGIINPSREIKDSLSSLESLICYSLQNGKLELDIKKTNKLRKEYLEEDCLPRKYSPNGKMLKMKKYFNKKGLLVVKYE